MDYASLVWASNITETHHNTVKTIQNKGPTIFIGCTAIPPTDLLCHENIAL